MNYFSDLKKALFTDQWQHGMPRRAMMVALLSIWVASLIAIIAIIPDYPRYQRRTEHIERLLRSNCAEWIMIKDDSLVPSRQPLATKCVPIKQKAGPLSSM